MLATKDNQRLYLNSWNYNAALILTKLAQIVKQNGGEVHYKYQHPAVISNRSVDAAKREYKEKIERYTRLEAINPGANPARTAALTELREKLADCEDINNDPVTVSHLSYIRFSLGGFRYYYELDDNPLFPFHFTKSPINNGKYSGNCYSQEDKKEWLADCYFRAGCTESEIKTAAQEIYNMVVSSKQSRVVNTRPL